MIYPKNALYYFFSYGMDKEDILSENLKKASMFKYPSNNSQEINSAPYILIFLGPTKGKSVELDGKIYVFKLHHVSIYSDYRDLSRNSCYHYTSRCKNDDIWYELHIYFDDYGCVVGKPSLKQLDAAQKPCDTVVSISDDESSVLIDCANAFCASHIPELRELHKKHKLQFEQKLQSFLESMQSYSKESETINALIEQAGELLAESASVDSTYEKILSKSIRQLKDDLEWLQVDLAGAEAENTFVTGSFDASVFQDYPSQPEEQQTVISIADPEKTKSKLKTKKFTAKQEELLKLTKEFFTLEAKYKEVTDIDVADLVKLQEKAAFLRFDLLDYPDSSATKIFYSFNKYQKQCTQRLLLALQEEDETAIAQLLSYIQFLPDDVLVQAIQGNHLKQVEILLKNGKFVLDHIQTKYDGKLISLLELAYENNYVDVFEKLLKYGASPFTAVYNAQPLAHLIINNHSKENFQSVLFNNYSRARYTILTNQLSLLCPDSKDAEKYRNETKMAQLMPSTLFTGERINNSLTFQRSIFTGNELDNIESLFANSPRLSILRDQIRQAHTDLLLSLSDSQKKEVVSSSDEIIKAFSKNKPQEYKITEQDLYDHCLKLLEGYRKIGEIQEARDTLMKTEKKKTSISQPTRGQARKLNKESQRARTNYDKLVNDFKKQNYGIMAAQKISEILTDVMSALKELESLFKEIDSQGLDGLMQSSFPPEQTTTTTTTSSASNINSFFNGSGEIRSDENFADEVRPKT